MQVLTRFISAFSTLLVTILLARNYGAAGYGNFTKMSVYVSIFYLLIDFGMNAVVLKKVHEEKEQKESFFSSLFILRLALSLFFMFLALSILSFLPYDSWQEQGFSPLVKMGIIILIPTILTQGLITSFNAVFQNELRYEQSTLSILVGSFATLIVVYYLSQTGAPLPLTVSAFVVGGIVSAFSAYLLSKKFLKFSTRIFQTNRRAMKQVFFASFPLGITLLFNTIHFRADIFILTATRSTQDVGIYGLATKFFEFPLAIPTFFMNAVYPLFLKSLYEEKKKNWQRMIYESALFLVSLSLLIIIGCYFLAPFLVHVKEEFVASILPFRILIFTLPLFFLSSLFMWMLIAQGKTWKLVWIYGLAMCVNVILNIVFIPRFGYNAAAITTGISEGVVLFLLGLSLRGTKNSSID
jgi:O-antigen/teichoic acid export membrane protein